MTALRYLDLALVWMSAPLAIALGAPALGILAGAIAWTVTRLIALGVERRARRRDDVREGLALNFAAMMGRVWLLVSTILAAGLAGSRQDGVAAAVLLLAAFTLTFATTLLTRSLTRKPTHA